MFDKKTLEGETEAQREKRATDCLIELQEVLKKYDCHFKVVYSQVSDGTQEWLVLASTNSNIERKIEHGG